jgi:exosortase
MADQMRDHPDAAVAPAGTLAVSPRAAIPAALILLAIFGWVFFFFLRGTVTTALRMPSDWGHTLVIPLISGYFIWLERDKLLAKPFKPAWSGIVPIALGLGIYFIGYLGPSSLIVHQNVRGAGVGLTIFGLALLFFGWRAMRYLWFPLAYLVVFGQTISDGVLRPVTEKLQDISALGAYYVLSILTIDVERNGNVLEVWSNGTMKPLNVAEACSGMRMLLAFMALGVAIAHTGLRFWWQKITLILAGIPVAIGVNVLRVATLGLLSLKDINFSTGEFHSFIGLIWLVPALLFFLAIRWVLEKLGPQTAKPRSKSKGPKNSVNKEGVPSRAL